MSKFNLFSDSRSSADSILYSCMICVTSMYILLISYFWYMGADNIISWNVISNLNQSSTTVSFSTLDKLVLSVSEPIFYIKEHYLPTGSIVINNYELMYLIGVVIGVLLLLSSTVRLKSIWFMLGIAILGAVLLSFKLEVTFNQLSKVPFLIAFFSIAVVAYLYNSWIKNNSIVRTFPALTLVTAILFFTFLKFNNSLSPFLQITSYSISTGLVLSCIFIFFVSHELISLILKVVSSTNIGRGNSVVQFSVASGIYLLNAGLIYLENSNKITPSSAVVSTWWLFISSYIAGFWGFKAYCQQTQIMSFRESGRWLYIGGGFITLATTGYLYATDNNPLIELLADFVSISHLVVGIVFFGYVIVNFLQPMRQKLAVYRVLYKPPFFQLILVRLIAVFGIFILFAFKNYYSLNQYLAGHYNALGDYSLAVNELFAAETYYKKSVGYDEYNHKGNYSLASLAQSQGDFTAAGFYFNQATKKQPSVYSYAGLSESLLKSNLYFDAVNVLKKGLIAFPNSNHLATNLSQQYNRASIIDSTYLYADIAYKNCKACNAESTNLLAFWLENAKVDRLDSVSQEFSESNSISALANREAISKKLNKQDQIIETIALEDSVLSINQFALIYNMGTRTNIENIGGPQEIQSLINISENSGFYTDLTFVDAKQNYFFGDKRIAFQKLVYLTRDESADTKMYDLTLAGWYLNEGIYGKAMNYFYKAGDTLSVRKLQLAAYGSKIDKIQRQYAEKVFNNALTINNYDAILQQAPFNPYVVEKVTDMLITNNQPEKAYNVAFDAVQVNTESLLLWKVYTVMALKNGLISYAEEGLSNVERLASQNVYQGFKTQYDKLIESRDNF